MRKDPPHPYGQLADIICVVIVINVWAVAILWGWKH